VRLFRVQVATLRQADPLTKDFLPTVYMIKKL
jgi:hypothetical protein